jgi:hypothetical protein
MYQQIRQQGTMASKLIFSPKQDRILGSLPMNDYSRLQDDLELLQLAPGQLLYESGDTLGHINGEYDRIFHLQSDVRGKAHRPATNIRIDAVPDTEAHEYRIVVINTSSNVAQTPA